jgi:hypothetical protein
MRAQQVGYQLPAASYQLLLAGERAKLNAENVAECETWNLIAGCWKLEAGSRELVAAGSS